MQNIKMNLNFSGSKRINTSFGGSSGYDGSYTTEPNSTDAAVGILAAVTYGGAMTSYEKSKSIYTRLLIVLGSLGAGLVGAIVSNVVRKTTE